jgi:Iron-containing redox enzyme
MPVNIPISTILQALLVIIVVFLPTKVYGATIRCFLRSRLVGEDIQSPRRPQANALCDDNDTCNVPVSGRKQDNNQPSEIRLYKDLYFKLQNLERFPEILPQSRDLLISLFTETLADALNGPEPGILSVEQYTPESLIDFLQTENDKTTREWEQYMARRRAGSPAEMFQDQEEAKWWLRQIAPVKYVDGAWLGHIHKITTPFALRRVTKDAWQVMSEELGDGDPHKNHVHVYRELMKDIGSGLPEADTVDFIHSQHQLNEKCVWKAAIAQLLISLFPHEFLPEILGFNLHFEALTLETMKAAKEVEEFGLNPYYFVLHISIDNADSGHTAIAMQAVVKYIEHVRQMQGKSSAQQAWRRVQAGFILSKGLSTGPQSPSERTCAVPSFPRNIREAEVIRIFRAKAPVAHKIHCSSRMSIGGRRLVDWLEPHAFAGGQWQMDFLDCLSNMRPWVCRGDSSKSRLIQELSWEGRMFGSFTESEVEAVKRWIDALGHPNPQVYWSFIGRTKTMSDQVLQKQDIRVDYPVMSPISVADLSAKLIPASPAPLLYFQPAVQTPANPDLSKLLPLWFTNPCLLESFVCIPCKTTTITASSIVRLLRAQSGFDAEGPGVAGMDEARRIDSAGLVELGLKMMQRCGLPEPASLKEVLETWPSEFGLKMLELSMRPMANFGVLLGLAWAFVGLHDAMTSSRLLSVASQAVLRQIVRRERECLEICFTELKDDKIRCADFHRGYGLGRAEIGSCFGQTLVVAEAAPSDLLS